MRSGSAYAATISTDSAAPVIAGMRLRAGRAGSGKGAARMVAQVIATARGAGATGTILVRGDSAYGTRAVIGACRRAGAQFSLVLTKNTAVHKAIEAIEDNAWIPVRYPGAVRDPDTGEWISDAEVAEIPYTAFASTTPVTARLIVRRVKDARHPDTLFPVWRYHPFFTNSTEPAADADITHRRHAIIETVFADLIDGPLAHMPSGRFGANVVREPSVGRPAHADDDSIDIRLGATMFRVFAAIDATGRPPGGHGRSHGPGPPPPPCTPGRRSARTRGPA